MLKLFKKNKKNIFKIKIDGMHCTSCSLNIDDSLEEIDGVISAKTSYAKSQTEIEFNEKFKKENAIKAIESLGYKVIL